MFERLYLTLHLLYNHLHLSYNHFASLLTITCIILQITNIALIQSLCISPNNNRIIYKLLISHSNTGTNSDKPVRLSQAHFMHRIDVSNLDKLKPLCGIINGFILVILQEFKDSNRKIQEVVSQSKLRGGFLSAIEHISRYFESDREATVIELKNCVDAGGGM